MHGRFAIFGFMLLLVGCTELPASQEKQEGECALGQSFDPAKTRTIRGRVVWDGNVPASEESLIRAIAYNPNLHRNPVRFSTPHVPRVHPENRGVENAVVFLRGIHPRRSKPWGHAKVRVEFQDRQLVVEQGAARTQVGFVRRGAGIEVVNRDSEYHNLRARGAAFFAMPLLEANQVHERQLTKAGVVELTCGAGYYWLHAHLFVAEHPYYVRTDADGQFTLDQVPAGSYEIVCWLPSWRTARKEVDPETGIIARLAWAEPKEQTQKVVVRAGGTGEITYRGSRVLFEGE